MKKWFGSAAVCVNDKQELLMVKQGTPDEDKCWSIPSGGKEADETFEECCIREVKEETGYDVHIIRPLFTKTGTQEGFTVVVQYFEVAIHGGE
ncbi:NUDIX hydrolase [Lentibacillus saliphilus]|uniref:NUDIX hydrolase n=1 Tax=Lentibacillus saliphilus TaxID=2737028 RepID=UPI0031BA614E